MEYNIFILLHGEILKIKIRRKLKISFFAVYFFTYKFYLNLSCFVI